MKICWLQFDMNTNTNTYLQMIAFPTCACASYMRQPNAARVQWNRSPHWSPFPMADSIAVVFNRILITRIDHIWRSFRVICDFPWRWGPHSNSARIRQFRIGAHWASFFNVFFDRRRCAASFSSFFFVVLGGAEGVDSAVWFGTRLAIAGLFSTDFVGRFCTSSPFPTSFVFPISSRTAKSCSRVLLVNSWRSLFSSISDLGILKFSIANLRLVRKLCPICICLQVDEFLHREFFPKIFSFGT